MYKISDATGKDFIRFSTCDVFSLVRSLEMKSGSRVYRAHSRSSKSIGNCVASGIWATCKVPRMLAREYVRDI